MKTIKSLITIVLLLLFCGDVFADRQLQRSEVLQLFGQLTGKPRKAWISAGTVKAVHEEYKAPKITDPTEINRQIKQKVADYQNSTNKIELTEEMQKMKLDAIPFNTRYELANESTMISNETVKYDGEKFYWEIEVTSRSDSVKPGKDVENNFMTDEFNVNWNGKRIFAWDGQKYTTYAASAKNAMVDTAGKMPRGVNGPLNVGIVPWGYGYYTYDNLTTVDSSAIETTLGGRTVVALTINVSAEKRLTFVIDTAIDYALLSYTTETPTRIISRQYSNYQAVAGIMMPQMILIEQIEAGTNKLLGHDLWTFAVVDCNLPGADGFEVQLEQDVQVEYMSPVTAKPVIYNHSNVTDTEQLLAERLAYAAGQGTKVQNCATESLKYTTGKLGKNVTEQQLAGIVNSTDNKTSLSSMKQLAESLGLYCKAVQTDIDSLKNLNNCQVILHIPGKQHFVVLDRIDESSVRIIDLTSDRFYYRTDVGFFNMDWSDGVALLISAEPIGGQFTEIANDQLGNIAGAAYYQCNRIMQEYNLISCDYIGGLCGGNAYTYWKRWGCGTADSGSCSQPVMERSRYCMCIEDIQYPTLCVGDGDWHFTYMRACL